MMVAGLGNLGTALTLSCVIPGTVYEVAPRCPDGSLMPGCGEGRRCSSIANEFLEEPPSSSRPQPWVLYGLVGVVVLLLLSGGKA